MKGKQSISEYIITEKVGTLLEFTRFHKSCTTQILSFVGMTFRKLPE